MCVFVSVAFSQNPAAMMVMPPTTLGFFHVPISSLPGIKYPISGNSSLRFYHELHSLCQQGLILGMWEGPHAKAGGLRQKLGWTHGTETETEPQSTEQRVGVRRESESAGYMERRGGVAVVCC